MIQHFYTIFTTLLWRKIIKHLFKSLNKWLPLQFSANGKWMESSKKECRNRPFHDVYVLREIMLFRNEKKDIVGLDILLWENPSKSLIFSIVGKEKFLSVEHYSIFNLKLIEILKNNILFSDSSVHIIYIMKEIIFIVYFYIIMESIQKNNCCIIQLVCF